MHTCLNCNHKYEGNYCPNCGQKAGKPPLDWKYIWKDILYFFHYDQKFTYTLGQLSTRPGETIRGFLEGKRVKYYKPITFVLFLGGIYGVLLYLNTISPLNLLSQMIYLVNDLIYTDEFKFPGWLVENIAFVEVFLFLPLFSIASYLIYRTPRFSFTEHLVLNAYLAGQRIFIGIITFPLLYIFKDSPYIYVMAGLINLIELGFTFWVFVSLFKESDTAKIIFLTFATFLLVFTELLSLDLIWMLFN
ncbi:MAG: DUF3667 domain-containing protein [Bacteroidota bacterium]